MQRHWGHTVRPIATGWMVVMTCQVVAVALVGTPPTRITLTPRAAVSVDAVRPTVVHSATLPNQHRPRPRWAGVIGRTDLASDNSLPQRAAMAGLSRTGGIYGG
jgi:hypothetical protein